MMPDNSTAAASSEGFVGREGPQLLLGDRPFYFTGFNAWQLPGLVHSNRSEAAEALLGRAAELGFHVRIPLGPLCAVQ